MRISKYPIFREDVLRLYREGKGIQTISKITGISTTTLHRNMLKDGVIFRELGVAQSKTRVKYNPFINLDNIEVQYWLGFLIADGGISRIANNITLNLSEKDVEHIRKYAKFIGIPNDILYIPCTKSVRVCFANKEVKRFLISLGITPNKSKTIEVTIPITNHVLRGIFDGDGCISSTTRGSKIFYKWSLVSMSLKLTNQIKDVLDTLDISYSLKCYKGLYIFSTSKKDSITQLTKFLYQDATIYLERKYSKMQAASQEIVREIFR